MELRINKRNTDKKSETNLIRRKKQIPAVQYAAGMPNENIYLEDADFQAILRKIKPGRLSTTVITLKSDDKEVKAIVKDIQYHRTTYNIEHIDFQILDDKTVVNVKVPIYCIGMADCQGIRLGGVLRQVIRKVKVRCLPKDIPAEFLLDISKLEMNQSKRLSDITFPETVSPRASLDEVAAAIVKR